MTNIEQALPTPEASNLASRIRNELGGEPFLSRKDAAEAIDALCNQRVAAALGREINIVFDGPPGPEAGRFVEVESPAGYSIRFGEWIKRDDGYWALRFMVADRPAPEGGRHARRDRTDEWDFEHAGKRPASESAAPTEGFQCPACGWHQGHDPEEWFDEEVRLRAARFRAAAVTPTVDLARPRCSTPSQEDAGSVSGERWRKKPVVIEAIQWTGYNLEEVFAWLWPRERCEVYYVGEVAETGPRLAVETLEGKTFADPGHWIIRGVKGELYPCAADIFAATYDPAVPRPTAGDVERAKLRDQLMAAFQNAAAQNRRRIYLRKSG